MKTKLLLLGVLSCSLLLTSCASKEDTSAATPPASPVETPAFTEPQIPAPVITFPEDSLLALASQQVSDMVALDFSSTVSSFSSDAANQLNEEGLRSSWLTVISDFGHHLEHYSISGQVEGEEFVVRVVETYFTNGLEVTLKYNAASEMTGVNLSYASIPRSYVENDIFQEIPVTIGDEFPLDGILTLPKDKGITKVVLLVQGSGYLNMDSRIGATTPFLDIAHGLAEQGIASLRYDKFFYTYPEEADKLGSNLTLDNEILNDVLQALDFLEQDDRIGEIYLLGHSLGGMLAPAIASARDSVTGIISMAGSPQPLYEITYAQKKEVELFALQNISDEESLALFKEEMAKVEEDISILRGDFSDLSSSSKLLGESVPYQQSAKNYAAANYLPNLNIPMLVLQGTEDFEVSPSVDYPLYQALLADHENVTFHLYSGLNHLMVESHGFRTINDYEYQESVDPYVILNIAEFILF